ncbi:MAG: glycosyltransferase family 2 protein, partial [Gammaproteobacteria bacterium]|nr:glycosyltransferase family 2 protein [Gammaproteobacteria bacterium]
MSSLTSGPLQLISNNFSREPRIRRESDFSTGSHEPSTTAQEATFQPPVACTPRVAIVILNLDGKTHTQRLLQSLSRVHCDTFDLEVIVVDNGSTDGSVPVIRQELKNFSQSYLIVNRLNLGAAAGRNQAIRYALERDAVIPLKYVLTLDNDTEVDPQVMADLVRWAETSRPEEVVFAPLLYFANHPDRRWANWWTDGWRLPVQLEADWELRDPYNNGKTVDGVSTAAALFKASAFTELGHFDNRLFFGLEDTEWFVRARQEAYEIKLVPVEGKVLHNAHQSLGGAEKGVLSPQRIYYVLRNMVLMMTLYSRPRRLRPIKLVKLGMHIGLYSLRTLRSMDWLGFKAIWAGLYDGLCRRTGAGRGAAFQYQAPPAPQLSARQTKTPTTAYLYFFSVGLLTTSLTVLYALTIDWSLSNVFIAGLQTLSIGYLLWAVADAIVQLLFLIVFRLWKGPLECRTMEIPDGIPSNHRTSLAYMLRSNHLSECEEAFDNMYRSYMDNLDVNGNLTTVLVSASTPLSIVQHEMDLRDKYRDRIRVTLLSEAETCKESYSKKVVRIEEDCARGDFWSRLFSRWHEQGYAGEELDEAIETTVERVACRFKYIHRTSTTLKKAGQYQDLMLLGSRGLDRPFTYLEEKHGNLGRSPETPVFGFLANLKDDQGLSKGHFESMVRELEARGAQDISDLKQAGQTHGTPEDVSYRYTVMLDADNRAPAGSVRSLVEIAAANPERGFLQAGLLLFNMDTWHAFREILAHRTVSKMSEALFRALGRFGAYGKGLANNAMFLERFVGTPKAPRETLPIDILSHDTIEALFLNPAYVPHVYFYEGVATNVFSRQMQLTRWALGDLMNAIFLLPRSVGRVFTLAKKLFRNSGRENPSGCFDLLAPSVTARYIAHLSTRAHLQAPLFFLWIFIETFGQGILVHTNPILMRAHLYFIVFGLVLLPKMYAPSLHFLSGIRHWLRDQPAGALREMDSGVRGFVAAWLEIVTAPFVYMPDILRAPVRLWRAVKSLIVGQAAWTVQAEVERETKHISFMESLKETWRSSALALGFTVALWWFEVPSSILLIAMLVTWAVFPVTAWLGARPMSRKQRDNPFLLWLMNDFDSDRLQRRSVQTLSGSLRRLLGPERPHCRARTSAGEIAATMAAAAPSGAGEGVRYG